MNPSERIDKAIADHADWRGRTLAEVRRIIRETVPDVTEEWKWMGTPTWSRDGILCIGNIFKDMVKVTFINGAKLGVGGVFNAELAGNKWRAIKIFPGDSLDSNGLRKAVLAAVAFNAAMEKTRARPARAAASRTGKPAAAAKKSKAARSAAKPKRAAVRRGRSR